MKIVLLQPKLGAVSSEDNLHAIELLVNRVAGRVSVEDLILLPEHFTLDDNPETYFAFIRKLIRTAGCTIVGGSHHRSINGKHVNVGNVIDAEGNDIGIYTKLRPYFNEQQHVVPGDHIGEVKINGRNFCILICADFWYSDILLRTAVLPDVVLVPSLSVSRKPGAAYSRSLWRHLAVSRAYELGIYVGISDWSENSSLPEYRACGVGGFADPTAVDPDKFFQPVLEEGISLFNLDFNALEEFRADRRMRGFFWK